MIALAGTAEAFRPASSLLERLAGWSVCPEVARRVCYRKSDELAQARAEGAPEAEAFAAAAGDPEFQADATKVNTTEGWRDMKIGAFARRPPGPPAPAERWGSRELPAPAARVAFAAIEEVGPFSRRWWPWAEALGLGEAELSVLGDGADWIWGHADLCFPDRVEVLDIFHASEWLAKAAKAGCGEGTEEAGRWLEGARLALLRDGYLGVCEYAAGSAEWVPDRAGLEGALPGVLNYLCGHRDRLNYALRLRQGRAIGSGLIEGACKQMIGRRMKRTGARWAVANANRMALLLSLDYSDAFPLYFTPA